MSPQPRSSARIIITFASFSFPLLQAQELRINPGRRNISPAGHGLDVSLILFILLCFRLITDSRNPLSIKVFLKSRPFLFGQSGVNALSNTFISSTIPSCPEFRFITAFAGSTFDILILSLSHFNSWLRNKDAAVPNKTVSVSGPP